MLSALRASSDIGGHPPDSYPDQTAQFPHTRALLAHIYRQHKPPDSYDSDAEGDDLTKVPSVFVTRVVSLLDQEHEDDLKALLRDHYTGIDDDVVSSDICFRCVYGLCRLTGLEQVEQHVLGLMHRHRGEQCSRG
jgi:hypothetical protein